ncbi:MAG: hypothetical protein ACK56W_20790 [Pirellula sp.]|nr:hypothetical protein [Pirellula sp.]
MSQLSLLDETVPASPENLPENGNTSSENSPSLFERFVSSFFQENNIKWMLMIGAAIVTVCSLKLVHQNWDSLNETLKYLSILLYVSAVYGFGEASDRLLGLRSTSTVLRVLTLLLIPIIFFSLGWLTEQSGMNLITSMPLLAIGGAVGWLFTDSIFKKFFGGRQITYQSAYFVLAMACALPKLTDYSLLVGGLIWLVGTAGTIKVNRHAFWLAEQHRKPAIFGFFPILLVGAQMLLLFSTKLSWMNNIEWLGFGLVLCSIPIALTTRTAANVFKARTGGLIPTLPLAIATAMFVGLILCAAGVTLSFHGFRWGGNSSMAAVPTLALASCIAWFAARDTRHLGFSWVAIVLTIAAYQCLPAMFSELSRSVVASAATSISEERLPIAFYGLTYLPLLIVFAIASRWMNRASNSNQLQYASRPLQYATTVMCLLLLALSATNVKAIFLIPLVHTALFAGFAYCWNDRRYLAISLSTVVLLSAAWVPYANAMFSMQLPIAAMVVSVGLLGCTLLTGHVDRWFSKFPVPERAIFRWPTLPNGKSFPLAVSVSGGLIGCVAAAWLVDAVPNITQPVSVWNYAKSAVCLLASWIAIYRTRHYLAGLAQGLVIAVLAVSIMSSFSIRFLVQLDIASCVLVAVSCVGYSVWMTIRRTQFVCWQEDRQALGLDVSNLCMHPSNAIAMRHSLLGTIIIPLADLATLGVVTCLSFQLAGVIQAGFLFEHEMLRWSLIVLIGWLAYAIGMTRSRIATAAFVGLLPIVASAYLQSIQLIPSEHRFSVLVWGATAWLMGVAPHWLEQQLQLWKGHTQESLSDRGLLTRYVPQVAGVWLLVIALGSVMIQTWSVQIAGLIAVAGLMVMYRRPVQSPEFTAMCMWGNILILLLIAPWFSVSGLVGEAIRGGQSVTTAPFLLAFFAGNIFLIKWASSRFYANVVNVWLVGLYALTILSYGLCLRVTNVALISGVVAIVAILSLATEELMHAVRSRNEYRVWAAFGIVGAALAFSFWHRWLPITGAGSLIAVIAGLSLQWLGARCRNNEKWSVVSSPSDILGRILPVVVTLIGVASLFAVPDLTSTAYLATAILLAGIATLYRSATQSNKADAWVAIVMLNIGIALVTRSTGWSDVQLYLVPIGLSILGLVELMKQQIPSHFHKSLRMIGSLTILVSPVYSMVVHESWWHMLSLLILSVLVILLSIGLRVKLPMYTGVAFLSADLLAMLVRSAVELEMLWVSGLGVGIAVIGVAALCEVYRERILSRVRMLSVELATWN